MTASPRSIALAGGLLTAGLVFCPAPSQAIGVLHTFRLTNSATVPSSPNLATPTKSYQSTPEAGSGRDPIGLFFGNARRPNNLPKLTSANDAGICLYKVGGSNNCGRIGPIQGSNGNGSANQSSIDLYFDRDVQLFSYEYGLLRLGGRSTNPRLVWTNTANPTDTSTETLGGRTANSVYSFANQFFVKAFQTITIAGFGGTNRNPGTLVRLEELIVKEILPPASSVPGPLPALGAGMAFAWSRRLRSRLASARQS